jgi:translation initiation factor RLI1
VDRNCRVSENRERGQCVPYSHLADYFTKVLEDDLKAVTKPQYVDQIPKAVKGTNRAVGYQLTQRCQVEKERLKEIAETLGMSYRQMSPCI